jgi:hypothetical protein
LNLLPACDSAHALPMPGSKEARRCAGLPLHLYAERRLPRFKTRRCAGSSVTSRRARPGSSTSRRLSLAKRHPQIRSSNRCSIPARTPVRAGVRSPLSPALILTRGALAQIKAPYPDLLVVPLEFLGERRVSRRDRNRVNRGRHVCVSAVQFARPIVVPIVTTRWSWRPSSLVL